MIKWLAGIVACLVTIAVCHAAYAEDVIIDLKGTWTGRVIRHVSQQGFVPFYSGMRLVMEEQNGTQYKGYLVNGTGRDETRVQFTGAIDLNNEYLYLRLSSGDVCIGQIASGNRLMLFVAGSDKDSVTVFKLRKTAAP
jgi:hypothetical protein